MNTKAELEIFEFARGAVDLRYEAMHKQNVVERGYYESRYETSVYVLAKLGARNLVSELEEYHAHVYNAFYNLRVYDYPTQ